MKAQRMMAAAILLSGCTVERIGPPGITLTRPIRVKAKDVKVFQDMADVEGHYTVVDTVFVHDDGRTSPDELEDQLREMAGARGANAIVVDATNRKPNGTRIDLKPTLDNPFDYFGATAIWIGDGEPPQKYLGTLGGRSR